jgi:hypothetical protein
MVINDYILVEEEKESRRYFVIKYDSTKECYTLKVLESSASTFIRILGNHVLKNNDGIVLGNIEFVVIIKSTKTTKS